MAGSDILVAGFDKNNEPIVQDRFAKSHSEPVIDENEGGTNDWMLNEMSREGDFLV